MMKKAKLLITLLALLVAASGYAQDSYREAVKNYLSVSGQIEKSKELLSSLSMLFEKNGEVDVDQLCQRYLDERYENDLIVLMLPKLTEKGITEAELKEVSSLLSMPEYKTFEEHQKDWMSGFLTDFLMSFINVPESQEDIEDMMNDEDTDFSSIGLGTLLGEPIQAREDIDPAYVEKFRNVMLESPFVKNMMEAMMKRFNENSDDNINKQEDREQFNNWLNLSYPNMLLNNAYGTITLEDLDYADLLYSNEAYCKVATTDNDTEQDLKTGNVFLQYLEWMEQQGAKKSEDPAVIMEFFKLLMNASGMNLDYDTPYDIDIEE